MKTNLNKTHTICHTRPDRVSKKELSSSCLTRRSIAMDSRIQSENDKMESGRSMVEMLGVLAIIGVLSVGGIAGYKFAMDKHQTNELLNELTKRANQVAVQLNNDPSATPDLSEFEQGFPGCTTCTFTVKRIVDAEVFMISVTNVPKAICKLALGEIGENSIIRASTVSECSDNLVPMGFLFNNDLNVDYDIEYLGEGEDDDEKSNGCTTNADCKSSEYCKVEVVKKGSICNVTSGVCKSAGIGTCDIVDKFDKDCYGGKLNWISAYNWCSRRGGNLTNSSADPSSDACQKRKICDWAWTGMGSGNITTTKCIKSIAKATINVTASGTSATTLMNYCSADETHIAICTK